MQVMCALGRKPRRRLWIPLLLVLCLGCAHERSEDLPPIPPPPHCGLSNPLPAGRLRVRNVGPETILDLTVQFPRDTLSFGDVRPGETTDYQDVSNGVFRYAALKYNRNSHAVEQPVVDFVGELPLPGCFTYELRLEDPTASGLKIRSILQDP